MSKFMKLKTVIYSDRKTGEQFESIEGMIKCHRCGKTYRISISYQADMPGNRYPATRETFRLPCGHKSKDILDTEHNSITFWSRSGEFVRQSPIKENK